MQSVPKDVAEHEVDGATEMREPPTTQPQNDQQRDDLVRRRARAVLNDYALTPLAMAAADKWIRLMAQPDAHDLARLRAWFLHKMNGRERAPPPTAWQAGCPELLGGLRAKPLWRDDLREVLAPFERHAAEIRAELLALKHRRSFQPLKIPDWASKRKIAASDGAGSVSHDAGDWNVFYLALHEVDCDENCSLCPTTARLLSELPRSYRHAFFSALTPGTHIIKHHGPTNKKLRVHLPLLGTEGAELRVADERVAIERDRCLVFDDSFEHEAWHRGASTRIVLVFDVWHPDLSDKEVQFFSFLQRSLMRAEMRASRAVAAIRAAKSGEVAGEEGGEEGVGLGDDFYSLLEDSKGALLDNSWWV